MKNEKERQIDNLTLGTLGGFSKSKIVPADEFDILLIPESTYFIKIISNEKGRYVRFLYGSEVDDGIGN